MTCQKKDVAATVYNYQKSTSATDRVITPVNAANAAILAAAQCLRAWAHYGSVSHKCALTNSGVKAA
jgi:hypothetical protein